MSKSESAQSSGWAFILTGSDPLAIPGSVIGSILLTVGMYHLRARYSERAGSFGRNILLLGVMRPIVFGIAIASGNILYSSGSITNTQVEKGLWVLIFVGPAISLLGLTLFGLTALRSKPMPRLNWLPLFAGIWYPVTFTLFSIYDIAHKGVFPDQYVPVLNFMLVIQFFALCGLGLVLINDLSKELATA